MDVALLIGPWVLIVLALLVAARFTFRTPGPERASLHARADALSSQIDSLQRQQEAAARSSSPSL
jgi:hypothetical protein